MGFVSVLTPSVASSIMQALVFLPPDKPALYPPQSLFFVCVRFACARSIVRWWYSLSISYTGYDFYSSVYYYVRLRGGAVAPPPVVFLSSLFLMWYSRCFPPVGRTVKG